ncbi:MAG: transposase IS66 [Methylocystaceae bacterium]|nr:MAG: transposase IS66 [Methylocystaceae bacterium]
MRAAQPDESKPCCRNMDAIGSGPPIPDRHGQNERVMALNRKNALFAGSDGGAENWAIVASLIETCKINGVDPQAYMTDVLTKIVDGHLASKLDELMPWAYAQPVALKDVA